MQPGEISCFARHLDNGLLEVVCYDDVIKADATGSRYATVSLSNRVMRIVGCNNTQPGSILNVSRRPADHPHCTEQRQDGNHQQDNP